MYSKAEQQALEVLDSGGDWPESMRAFMEAEFGSISPKHRRRQIADAKRSLQLVEARRQLGLQDDERYPDLQLKFEVADMFEADDTPLLCEWFKLRLLGELPTERDQIRAALVLEYPAFETNHGLLERNVDHQLARRGRHSLEELRS